MKKILVPIDGSAASKIAAEKAIETAIMQKAELTFIHVVTFPDLYNISSEEYLLKHNLSEFRVNSEQDGKKFLDKFVDSLNIENLVINKLIAHGQPYEEIVRVAESQSFDLIVMGRRGFSKIKRFFIGSVTQRVIAESPCPVLVVME